jgi:hypothetical protein
VRTIAKWQVINCGSVGAPYDGDVRASYVLMESAPTGWQVEIRRIRYDVKRVEEGYHLSGLAEGGGALGEMFLRTVLTGQPYVSDFNWWARQQPLDAMGEFQPVIALYDAQYGPGRWAFPLPS